MEDPFSPNDPVSDPIYDAWEVEDPLGRDRDTDIQIVTTRRALCRMAFVAAETAARFEREGIDYDPIAWMMTPRRLFEGESALDACLERTGFKRAVILHGLSIGVDAYPHQIDELMDDDDDLDMDEIEEAFEHSQSPGHRGHAQMIGNGQVSLAVPNFRAPARRAPKRPEVATRANPYSRAVPSTLAKAGS